MAQHYRHNENERKHTQSRQPTDRGNWNENRGYTDLGGNYDPYELDGLGGAYGGGDREHGQAHDTRYAGQGYSERDRDFLSRTGQAIRHGWNRAGEVIREGWDRMTDWDENDRHPHHHHTGMYEGGYRDTGSSRQAARDGSRERNYGGGSYPSQSSRERNYGSGGNPAENSRERNYGGGHFPESSRERNYGSGSYPQHQSREWNYGSGSYPRRHSREQNYGGSHAGWYDYNDRGYDRAEGHPGRRNWDDGNRWGYLSDPR